jgi:Tfp pilus assembly protein PilV
MPGRLQSDVSTPTVPPRAGRRGFTVLEVMVAAAVMLFGITTAILTLQRGFQALDAARNLTYASQVMQTELERLRLRSWDQLQSLQDSGAAAVTVEAVSGLGGEGFTCTRTIRDIRTDMKEITLAATWGGHDGRPQTARLVTRYGRNGLYDYFYTAH